MKTVLVVDDEPKIVQIARDYLEYSGFAVLTASDGKQALATAREQRPDLIVLDIGLPEMDGLDVTRAIRRDSSPLGNVPIIMLTARGEGKRQTDRAWKWVRTITSSSRLVPRNWWRGCGRSCGAPSPNQTPPKTKAMLRVADVTIDVPRMRVEVAGKLIELTNTEFQLLMTLAQQPGRLFTRAQLLDAVRGVAFESYERAIDAHVKNIRRKLEPDPREPRYVLTVYGVGYKFAEA